MKQKPTIRTLAKLAEVSYSTVSLALRNHPRIRPEVREHIQRLALEAGYKPDPVVAHLLARLRSNRQTTYQSSLAFLCIDQNRERLMTIPTFQDLLTGSQERASYLGYSMDTFFLHHGGISPRRLFTILKARNIRGLLFVDTLRNESFSRKYDCVWGNSASVALGLRPTYPCVDYALNDHFTTTKQAVAEAFSLGYSRPGLCIPQEVDDWVENRFSGGFKVALQNVAARRQASIFNFGSGQAKAFAAWVRKEKPDVILTLEAVVAEWLLASGMRVPEDIGVIQLDGHGNPAWAGMEQNIKFVGRTAVDLLIGQLHRNEFGVPPVQFGVTIASTWISGPTVRAAPSSVRRQIKPNNPG